MNLPNKITLSRIFLVPLFMVFIIPIPEWLVSSPALHGIKPVLEGYNGYIQTFGYIIATCIFVFASATDAVDGYIARKHRMVTTMGKFLDPIADKLLITAAIIALVANGSLSGWSAMVIIGREFIVTTLRLIAVSDGIIISASRLGKIKTIAQMIAVGMMLIRGPITEKFDFAYFPLYFPLAQFLMFIAVVLTIWSGYDYVVKNYHIFSKK